MLVASPVTSNVSVPSYPAESTKQETILPPTTVICLTVYELDPTASDSRPSPTAKVPAGIVDENAMS